MPQNIQSSYYSNNNNIIYTDLINLEVFMTRTPSTVLNLI